MLADDPNQSRFGEESPQYYEDTTRVYLKYSKDQEPVMPIYDQPITLTVTQRPYQMPQSYNRKYYQSFIKSANEKDETEGMLISDSMKKLLLPYIAAKKQKVQNTESSDNNPTTSSKQDTQATTDAVVTKPTELTHTRFESESIITTTEKRNLVPSTNTDQYPTRFQPDSTIQQNQGNISPPQRPNFGHGQTQNTVQYPPPSNVHPNRVYSHDPDRIVFPGAQSETRRVYGYYHQSQPNRGFTPQLTEMQPVHHRPN
ncbi:uncharacterized protein LOC116347754 [Contarinia nasturtii]|uniref:uncharacterized protein LOC116347754 n=1 Tax=Contarinia nasturtii TaxID=265458 RepID=UPI0012D4A855|nr:uncharacterized protein LOC116347754 [Contarinia nasturtii]